MTQRFSLYLAMVCSSILAAGCNLSSPPECITGKTKCENHPDIANSIGAVCGTDQVWHHYACPDVCNEAGTDCQSLDNIPGCSVEGEEKCVDTDTVGIRITCINQKWVPAFCAPGGSCADNTCDSAGKCENGDQFCAYVDTLNQSVSATCIDNQWVSQYCPEGLACDGNTCGSTQTDDVTQCGSTKVNCSSSVAGWQNGVCHDGQCEARDCISGYHLYGNTCEINDDTHCGTHENSCTAGVSIENSTAVSCKPETGICEVTSCHSGYHLYDNTCEINDDTHCGTHENSCTASVSVENSTAVSCKSETGICEVTQCNSGYHIYDNSCEINDDTHCGTHENSCTAGVSVENSTAIACVQETGVCEVTGCDSGYHIYENTCELNDETHCGSHENSCTPGVSVENSTSVACVPETGVCEVTQCVAGYHIYNNDCEKDDNDHCGSHEDTCTTTMFAGSESVSCDTGTCIVTSCNESDGSGYLFCNNTCINKLSDNDNCGSCGHPCTGFAVCKDGVCVEHTCGDGVNDYLTQTVKQPVQSDMPIEPTSFDTNAFCINSPELLNTVREAINRGEHYPEDNTDNAYILVSDLTLDPENWQPIGTYDHPFQGYFIGNHKAIHLDSSPIPVGESYYGFFGSIYHSYITDMDLYIDMSINGDHSFIGGVAGDSDTSLIYNSTIHTNITSTSISSSNQYIGGVIGGLNQYSHIYKTDVTGSVSSHKNVGGVAGFVTVNAYVEYSTFDGSVYGNDANAKQIGGIAGYSAGSISNCTTSGTMLTGSYMGGIAGMVDENTGLPITKCSSSMAITDGSYLGGVVGVHKKGTISNSYATGTVTSAEGEFIGGFVGDTSATITACYAIGDVTGGTHTGGFAGHIDTGTYTDCAAFGKVIGYHGNTGGFAGNTTNEFTISRSTALGTVSDTSANVGGFIGELNENNTVENSYALTKIDDSIDYQGNFIGYSHSCNIRHCYCSSGALVIGMSAGSVSYTNLMTLTFATIDGKKGITPCYEIGTVPLIEELGTTNWREMACTLDIGDGDKLYTIPLPKTISPVLCEE